MEISSNKPLWDDILQEVGGKPAASLEEQRNDTLVSLLGLIKVLGLSFTRGGHKVDEEMVEKILAYCLPRPSPITGGNVDKQLEAGIEALKEKLQAYKRQHPNEPMELLDFIALAHTTLANDRVDEYVLDGYIGVMGKEFSIREQYGKELKSLTAELKVYSLIQSQINAKLAKSEPINITRDFDLLDRTLYGYAPGDGAWLQSAEYKFLTALDTGKSSTLSIKDFLVGSPKESGAMDRAQLKDEYDFSKENNPIASLATMVGDRSRPINDRVSEKTTLLNDVSSRYNAAIEAINRFVQKYATVLSDILRAV